MIERTRQRETRTAPAVAAPRLLPPLPGVPRASTCDRSLATTLSSSAPYCPCRIRERTGSPTPCGLRSNFARLSSEPADIRMSSARSPISVTAERASRSAPRKPEDVFEDGHGLNTQRELQYDPPHTSTGILDLARLRLARPSGIRYLPSPLSPRTLPLHSPVDNLLSRQLTCSRRAPVDSRYIGRPHGTHGRPPSAQSINLPAPPALRTGFQRLRST